MDSSRIIGGHAGVDDASNTVELRERLDGVFRKGFLSGVSLVGLGAMVYKAPWPDWLRSIVFLGVIAGYAYLVVLERRRGYK
jgi:hypothetical protein